MNGRVRLLVGPLAVAAVALQFAPRALGVENAVSLRTEELGLQPATAERLRAAIAAEQWPAVEDILFKAASSSPQPATLLRALGIAHYQAGRYFSAASALKRSDALAPLEPEARFLLAGSFIRLERRHWARAELDRLVAQQGDSDRYRLSLAQVHYDQGQFSAALSQLDQILESTPELAAAHDLRGQCLEGLGRPSAAITALEAGDFAKPRRAHGVCLAALSPRQPVTRPRRLGRRLRLRSPPRWPRTAATPRPTGTGHRVREGEQAPPRSGSAGERRAAGAARCERPVQPGLGLPTPRPTG